MNRSFVVKRQAGMAPKTEPWREAHEPPKSLPNLDHTGVRTSFTYHGPTFLRPDGSVSSELRHDIRDRFSAMPRLPVADSHDMTRIDFERSCTKALKEEQEASIYSDTSRSLQPNLLTEKEEKKYKDSTSSHSSQSRRDVHSSNGMETGGISLGENSTASIDGERSYEMQKTKEKKQRNVKESSSRRSTGNMARHGANSLNNNFKQSNYGISSSLPASPMTSPTKGATTNTQIQSKKDNHKATINKKKKGTKANAPVHGTRKKKPFNSESLFDCLLDLKFGKTDAKTINQIDVHKKNGQENGDDAGWDITSFQDNIDVRIAMAPPTKDDQHFL